MKPEFGGYTAEFEILQTLRAILRVQICPQCHGDGHYYREVLSSAIPIGGDVRCECALRADKVLDGDYT